MKRLLSILLLTALGFGGLRAQDAEKEDAGRRAQESGGSAERGSSPALHSRYDSVHVGRPINIGPEEIIRDLVAVAGDAAIQGKIRQNAVIVLGNVRFDGETGGDLVVLGGDLHLGKHARVGGNLVHVGNEFSADADAEVNGEKVIVPMPSSFPSLGWLQGWVAQGLFAARPFPPGVKWAWMVAGIFLLLHVLIATIFSRSAAASVRTLERSPIASFFLGILFMVLAALMLVILAITIIGVIAIPFLLCAMLLAWFLAGIAVFGFTGSRLFNLELSSQGSLALAVVIGSVLFYAVYMLPIVGFLVWGVVTTIGLGAVLLAAFSGMKREAVAAAPAPAPVGAPAPVVLAASVPSGGSASAASDTPPVAAPTATASDAPPIAQIPPPLAFEDDLTRRAGFWQRLGATFLDLILVSVATKPALFVIHAHDSEPLFLFFWTVYHVVMWSWKATTIGGIVLKIKIIRLDGQPLSFSVALVRSLSSFFSAVPCFLGFFWVGWSSEKQGWHDMIAGTTIVKVPQRVSLM